MHLKPIVLICVIASVSASAMEKPRFKFSLKNNIMLSWEESWEVGSSNKLAFLSINKKLIIKIVVEGNVGSGLKRILKFTCQQGAIENTMDLEILRVYSNERQCESTIPFSMNQKDSAQGEFEFSLLSAQLPYDQAFTQKLELKVHVEYNGGILESNSLFVWNLEAINKLNPSPLPGETYSRRLLTSNAIEFLKQMNMSKEEFGSLQFLNPAVSQMIKSAPEFLKSKVNVGAVLLFDSGYCANYQLARASMFVNYHSKLDDRNHNLLKHMYLDIETGVLHYSRYGLSSVIYDFYNIRIPTTIGICSTLSFAGHGQPYDKAFPVEQKLERSALMYAIVGTKSSNCKIVSGVASRQVMIFSGMDYTPLVCPIMCSDPGTLYKFFHGDAYLMPESQRDWSEKDGVRIAKTGNIIEFPPLIYKKHLGDYRCEAGGLTFRFNILVISMPQFLSKSFGSAHGHGLSSALDIYGNLPSTIYAMEGESLSYNCTVFFSNVHSTKMKPVFYTIISSKRKWRQLNLNDFNYLVNPSDKATVVQSVNSGVESMTMTLNIDTVPPANNSTNQNFTHRYECEGTVEKADTELVGMPSYTVQSGATVFFINRPSTANFDMSMAKNCSVQKCSAAQGAYFQLALKPNLVAYLKSIGVTVTGYFKIDNSYVSDVAVFNDKGVAEISYDIETMNLTFKVNPITRGDVLRELQKWRTLTPVFNFQYKQGSILTNLHIKKDKHGLHNIAAGMRDCRVDPLCFYSTDFDSKTTLKSLSLSLDFQGKPMKPEPASTSMIVAIILAVVILLVIVVLLVYLLRRDTGQT